MRSSFSFLACLIVGRVASHPLCFIDDKPTDLNFDLTFCPEAQDGACCTDVEEENVSNIVDMAGNLSDECGDLYKQIPFNQREANAAEYWRLHGKELPLALRAVAQTVFGCPASAGVMERDFCIADMFMPRKRGSLDPAFLEMSLFLRAQYEYIPDDVPRLSDEDALQAIPERFRDQTMLDEVNVLDFLPEEESDDADAGEQGVEWVLPDPVLPEPTSHGEDGGAAAGNGGGASSREDGGAAAGNGGGVPADSRSYARSV